MIDHKRILRNAAANSIAEKMTAIDLLTPGQRTSVLANLFSYDLQDCFPG
jgi:hypothetical protein